MSTRRAGVLLHPTSLPGGHGIGDLGQCAHAFVEWLHRAGVRAWQVLPLVPPGAGDSPYSSWSAFAGNPWLIDLEDLREAGLLDAEELAGAPPNTDRADFGAVHAFKAPRLEAAADRLLAQARHPLHPALEAFREANRAWLEDAALFTALRRRHAEPWWRWPAPLRDRDHAALAEARAALAAEIDRAAAIQFFFDHQWARLRAACDRHGIALIGDLPIYVDADSADVWAHRSLFALDDEGRRTEVAGVPPDAFSETGQLWGNPLYRWDRLEETGFSWWIARLRRALALTGEVRIDHFRGFSAYWAVPADAEDARPGRWVPGPGRAVFDAFRAALGVLPILAEDLGVIDDPVRRLLADAGLPGMLVLQFAFGGDAENPYLPHNHAAAKVVYTGTHDNDTTRGWWDAAPEHVRDHFRRYFATDGRDVVDTLVRATLASVADTAILPAQDVLGLGGATRMNTPATPEGNWRWRLWPGQLGAHEAERVRVLLELYGR